MAGPGDSYRQRGERAARPRMASPALRIRPKPDRASGNQGPAGPAARASPAEPGSLTPGGVGPVGRGLGPAGPEAPRMLQVLVHDRDGLVGVPGDDGVEESGVLVYRSGQALGPGDAVEAIEPALIPQGARYLEESLVLKMTHDAKVEVAVAIQEADPVPRGRELL